MLESSEFSVMSTTKNELSASAFALGEMYIASGLLISYQCKALSVIKAHEEPDQLFFFYYDVGYLILPTSLDKKTADP
jgi:hypothetical protein